MFPIGSFFSQRKQKSVENYETEGIRVLKEEIIALQVAFFVSQNFFVFQICLFITNFIFSILNVLLFIFF